MCKPRVVQHRKGPEEKESKLASLPRGSSALHSHYEGDEQGAGIIHQRDVPDLIKLGKLKELGHRGVFKPKGRRNITREFGSLTSGHSYIGLSPSSTNKSLWIYTE